LGHQPADLERREAKLLDLYLEDGIEALRSALSSMRSGSGRLRPTLSAPKPSGKSPPKAPRRAASKAIREYCSLAPSWISETRAWGPPAAVCVRGAAQRPRSIGGDLALPVQILEGMIEGVEGDHGDAAHHGRLLGVTRGHEEAMNAPPSAVERDRQHPPHGLDAAVEGELAEHGHVLEPLRLERLCGDEYPQSHGQVEGRADLSNLGGRQVHCDPVHGELEAGVANGCTDAIAALAHRGSPREDSRGLEADAGG